MQHSHRIANFITSFITSCTLGIGLLLTVHSLSQAQTSNPSRRPFTLIVPVAAGAANDLIARTLAAEVKDELGAVVVDNKPGGNGIVGAEQVRRAPADGRTLLVAPSSYVIMAAMDAATPYDFARDFTAVINAANLPFYMVVNQEALPAKNLAELVQLLRARPGKISYGSAGNGSPHHFAAEMLKLRSGVDMLHVPYKGMAQGIPDLLEGRIQLVITGLPAVATQLKSGKLRVLATTESRRTALNPDIPTFAEAGVPGVEMETWLGMVAPAGSPRAAIEQANAAFNRALKLPQVREKLAAQGLEIMGGTAEAFNARIRSDIESFRKVSKAAGLKPE
jgi:tripartite-type tricarboxylate transporter receptor subunit TctC